MFKAAPRLSNLILLRATLCKGNSRLGPAVHGPSVQFERTKATSTSLDLATQDTQGAGAPEPIDVYSEQDLLKRAKFRHTGKEVQQKIASEVSPSAAQKTADRRLHHPPLVWASHTKLSGITLLLIFTPSEI